MVKEEWAVSLSTLLTGKALEVYHRLSPAQANDYEKLKGELRRQYGLTAEGYRKKLRESKTPRRRNARTVRNSIGYVLG